MLTSDTSPASARDRTSLRNSWIQRRISWPTMARSCPVNSCCNVTICSRCIPSVRLRFRRWFPSADFYPVFQRSSSRQTSYSRSPAKPQTSSPTSRPLLPPVTRTSHMAPSRLEVRTWHEHLGLLDLRGDCERMQVSGNRKLVP